MLFEMLIFSVNLFVTMLLNYSTSERINYSKGFFEICFLIGIIVTSEYKFYKKMLTLSLQLLRSYFS